MNEIKWYFPEDLDEAAALLKQEGVVPHGGGTGLLMQSGLGRIQGLMDVSRLPIHDFRVQNGWVEIGAAMTFADIVRHLSRIDAEHILIKALSQAASTPLRNRITLGGSIALFPPWSDLMGPLLALDADVMLAGEPQNCFPLTNYINDSSLKKQRLITGIRFRANPWHSAYYRAARIVTDYPAFTITILLKTTESGIEDIRIVVVGNRQRYQRLTALEADFRGAPVNEVSLEGIDRKLDVEFVRRKLGSPEYLKHLAAVELHRGLSALLNNDV